MLYFKQSLNKVQLQWNEEFHRTQIFNKITDVSPRCCLSWHRRCVSSASEKQLSAKARFQQEWYCELKVPTKDSLLMKTNGKLLRTMQLPSIMHRWWIKDFRNSCLTKLMAQHQADYIKKKPAKFILRNTTGQTNAATFQWIIATKRTENLRPEKVIASLTQTQKLIPQLSETESSREKQHLFRTKLHRYASWNN